MSKIFEALKNVSGAIPEFDPALLGDALTLPVDESVIALAPGPVENQAEPAPVNGPVQVRSVPFRAASGVPVLAFDQSQRAAVEQYRIARTKIIQHPRQPRTIVVCSAGAADGKTVTAINLAGTLSLKAESSVVLVDADFRRGAVADYIGVAKTPGLADVIEGTCDLEAALLSIEQLPNLCVLPAGEARANPPELLDSQSTHDIFVRLRNRFEYVIVDSPPMVAVADFDLIQALCEGVVLVVRPDHTNRNACFKAIETVAKDKFLGIIVNSVEDWFVTRSHSHQLYYQSRYDRR
jgi:capsular exopolysaccharide synthesis family protein